MEWYQFATKWILDASVFSQVAFGVEVRHVRQQYQRSVVEIADEYLSSFGFTSAVGDPKAERLTFSVWYGEGRMHPEGVVSSAVSARGLQAQLGWIWLVDDQLELFTAVARDWRRDGSPDGGTQGGFGPASDGRSVQNRFVLRLSYSLGDRI
jgi:hypothetical protein